MGNIILLKNAVICDAANWLLKSDILVKDGMIIDLAETIDDSLADKIINLQGYKLMPGLIDAHIHLVTGIDEYNDISLKNWAMSGVTKVRDLGLGNSKSIEEFFEWSKPVLKDPSCADFITCGRFVTAVNGYCHIMPDGQELGIGVSTVKETEDIVRKLYKLGCQGIKTCMAKTGFGSDVPLPNINLDMFKAMTETAYGLGMWVCAHVLESEFLPTLIEGGVKEMAHIPKDYASDEILKEMADKNIYVTPTMITTSENTNRPPDPPGLSREPELMKKQNAAALDNTKRFISFGGKVAMGTDTMRMEVMPRPVGVPVIEMQLLKKAGLDYQGVITAATLNAAAVCGTDDVEGLLKKGYKANIIAIKNDFDEAFSAFENVDFVMNKGEIIKF